METENALKGKARQFYSTSKPLRICILIFLFFVFFFSKPSWCVLRSDMSKDCNWDADGNDYIMNVKSFFNYKQDYYMQVFLMVPLILFQFLKIQYAKKKIEYVKFYTQLACFAMINIIFYLRFFGFIRTTDIKQVVKFVFIVCYFKVVLRTLMKVVKQLEDAGFIFILLLIALFIFSILCRILFLNERVSEFENELVYFHSFTSIWRTIDTLFCLIFLENSPYIFADAFKVSFFSMLLLLVYMALTAFILLSLLTGIFYNSFQKYYIQNLRYVVHEYPQFSRHIEKMKGRVFMNLDAIDEVVYLSLDKSNEDAQKQRRRRLFVDKLRRVVAKIALIRRFHRNLEDEVEHPFHRVKKKFFYRLIVIVASLQLMLLPSLVLDPSMKKHFLVNVMFAEFLASAFLVEHYFAYTFQRRKKEFWKMHRLIDIFSTFGILLMSTVLILEKNDFHSDTFYASFTSFVVWSLFCVMKVIRIHMMLYKLTNYRVISVTLVHMVPVLMDLVIIYLIVLTLYAILGMTSFGGLKHSTSFGETFEMYAGRGVPTFHQHLNFNDIINSFMTLFSLNFSGFLDTLQQLTVAYYHKHQNALSIIYVKAFIYSYFCITELIVINIIVGFVIDIMAIYLINTKEIKEAQDKKISDKKIIEYFLDKEVQEQKGEPSPQQAERERVLRNQMEAIINKGPEQMDRERQERLRRLGAKFAGPLQPEQ